MTISSTTVIDKVEVLQLGQLQVRQAEIITKDNVEIARTYTRWICVPGDNVSTQDPKIQAIANALWTSDVISAYQASIPAQPAL
jgi:hypothetical protein